MEKIILLTDAPLEVWRGTPEQLAELAANPELHCIAAFKDASPEILGFLRKHNHDKNFFIAHARPGNEHISVEAEKEFGGIKLFSPHSVYQQAVEELKKKL